MTDDILRELQHDPDTITLKKLDQLKAIKILECFSNKEKRESHIYTFLNIRFINKALKNSVFAIYN